jgi:translation initiation factor 3 subunit L
LYARCGPTLRDRCDSWDNYCELFGLLLHSNVNMQLPNIWLWDMIDEFLYQFQSFCQYRGKVTTMSPEELENLKRCDKVRSMHTCTSCVVASHLLELHVRLWKLLQSV